MNNTLAEGQFGHGGSKDKFDSRDFQYKDIAGAAIPFDWSVGFDVEAKLGYKILVKNQGQSLSCGGQAWSYLGEVLEALSTGSFEERSAKYIYAQTNLPGGGSAGRDNADIFIKQGVACESVLSSYPATEANLTNSFDITPAIRQNATGDVSTSYAQVALDIDSVAEALRDTNGVIIGVDGENNNTWLSSNPQPPVNTVWRHWVLVIKARMFNGVKQVGIINSWGTTVGENGIQWLSENYFTTGHVFSAWTHVLKTAQPSTAPFLVDMVYGQTGSEIMRLQAFLGQLGYFPLTTTPTGYYGSITRSSVYHFQLDHVSLTPWETLWQRGSKVGPKTRLALNSLIK